MSRPSKDTKPLRNALLPKSIKTKEEAWNFAEESRLAGSQTMAVNAYTAVLKWDPEHVEALKYRCVLLMRLRRFLEAEADAFRLQQLLPTSAVGYVLRGRIFINMQEYGKAAFEFQSALSVEPDLQILKLKEWADQLITASIHSFADEKDRQQALLEPGVPITGFLQTLVAGAESSGVTVNAHVAALYSDQLPCVAGFCKTSCVVEEELEKLPDSQVITAAEAARVAMNAKWPLGDEIEPHDCSHNADCRKHSYIRVAHTESECVPHIVNLVDTIAGR